LTTCRTTPRTLRWGGGDTTTIGGTKYVNVLGGTLTFTFAAPVQAFGAYFTGVQPGFFQDTIGIDDVRLVPAPVPEASTTLSFGLLLALDLGGAVVAAKRKNKA